jgi:hypothetical protein
MSAGKGDAPRPVIGATFRENYEAIFRGVDDLDEECQECLEQSRLLGMSAQRESDLRGKMLRMEAVLMKIADGHDDPQDLATKALGIWPNDPSPFDSDDHDNDDNTYAERI